MKREMRSLHPAIEALVDALARRLVRDHLAGTLQPLEAQPPPTGKRPTLPVKRKAA
jgi:hypothetical protein